MLRRNIGKPFVIMEDGSYLWFDIFHNFVNEIHSTHGIGFAWHFETEEDAEKFIKTISYPREIKNYKIVVDNAITC